MAFGRSSKKHDEYTKAYFDNAVRWVKAAETALRNGNCEGAVENAANARTYAEQAVQEAAAGAPPGGKGPTAWQSKTSNIADAALMVWKDVHQRCVRRTPKRRTKATAWRPQPWDR
jgi:hypothetical protein